MANLINKKLYNVRKTILIAPELAFTIPAYISNDGVNENENGKKIIKAGTPLGCDVNFLMERNTELKVDFSNPKAVLLHDTDVTDGTVSSSVIIDGYVDLSKLDEDVAELYTGTTINALPKITFFNNKKEEQKTVFKKLINVPSSINYLRTEHESDPKGTITKYQLEPFPANSKPYFIQSGLHSWAYEQGIDNCAIRSVTCDTDCVLRIRRGIGNVWDEEDYIEVTVFATEKDFIDGTSQIYTIKMNY